ncbi:hypothetical protein OE88DRAFT_1662988 [Heliocybe sulcata]|uniref:Uncharacterized protein n=1 Tax=Heliocybe sulcata TaxID=5364 RepID=A0A5C3MYZ9_9AGAM|nr:hypothetical protein OE88DRAFT_1662988 [Heliocybe sulcata]
MGGKSHADDNAEISGRFGLEGLGDLVRAIVAYSLRKAIAPIRISLSMYLSPAFSRRLSDPVSRSIIRLFTRK